VIGESIDKSNDGKNIDGRVIHINADLHTLYFGYMKKGARHGWGTEIPITNLNYRNPYEGYWENGLRAVKDQEHPETDPYFKFKEKQKNEHNKFLNEWLTKRIIETKINEDQSTKKYLFDENNTDANTESYKFNWD